MENVAGSDMFEAKPLHERFVHVIFFFNFGKVLDAFDIVFLVMLVLFYEFCNHFFLLFIHLEICHDNLEKYLKWAGPCWFLFWFWESSR
jgi:hypothetical protein